MSYGRYFPHYPPTGASAKANQRSEGLRFEPIKKTGPKQPFVTQKQQRDELVAAYDAMKAPGAAMMKAKQAGKATLKSQIEFLTGELETFSSNAAKPPAISTLTSKLPPKIETAKANAAPSAKPAQQANTRQDVKLTDGWPIRLRSELQIVDARLCNPDLTHEQRMKLLAAKAEIQKEAAALNISRAAFDRMSPKEQLEFCKRGGRLHN